MIPVSHLRDPKLREGTSRAQGKARTFFSLQSHSHSKARALTSVVILRKLRVIPLAQASAPQPPHGRAWHGPPSDGEPAKADPLPFSVSCLPPRRDRECEVWSWAEGSAHPPPPSPAAERAGTHAHPAPGAPAADWPPTLGRESHTRILILLARKPYPNVSAAQLRYLYGASAVLSALQRAKFMLL